MSPKIRVPDGFDEAEVRLAGVEPNENERRLGPPRNEHVRVDVRDPRDAQVREDDEGRYVGVRQDYVGPIAVYFAENYDVTIADVDTAGVVDRDELATPDTDADGGSETADTDGPLPDADDTADAHWRTVTGAIENGHYDGSLDTVAENDDRDSVQEAITARRED